MPSYIWDTEGNGLVHNITKMHLSCLRNVETRETIVGRQNDVENTIEDTLRLLMEADQIIGHNVLNYDLKATKKLYPWFNPKGEIIDTLVASKVARPDLKTTDVKLVKSGRLPGKLQGSYSLKAWGYRLGKHKGDYAEEMERQGLNPWAAWNQPMEDYCVGDLDVTEILWTGIQAAHLPQLTMDIEHEIHEIADEMRDTGFPFDIAAAERLAPQLESEEAKLHAEIVKDYGKLFVPAKRIIIAPMWEDPEGINAKKKYPKPREEYGEDYSRAWWGDIVVPKVNHHDKKKGQPYCPAKWVDFNPSSRSQIIDRFVIHHGWKPTEFTEAGNPSVDDAVLKNLAETIPAAKPIAEMFFIRKLLGYIKTGDQSWIKNYNPETKCIHATTNTCGAVTRRGTHSHPNLSQVPGVIVGPDKKPLLGRVGEYGWECRSLFGVPKEGDWTEVGTDLSGIEYRMLAELMAEFDGGATIALVVSGRDPHTHNSELTGIPDRSLIKRALYCIMYGGGDWKLGITANPLLGVDEARKLGAALRAQIMTGLPALDKAIKKIKKEAARGYIIGLDGARIQVRNEYSALNTRLQSDAALVAKLWMILTRRNLIAAGAQHGWDGDFTFLGFFHDEIQKAVYTPFAKQAAEICKASAAEAGLTFGFKCPIGAESKLGAHWGACH